MTDLQIFKNAPPEASVEELKLYLDGVCGGDATLRARVESLFQAEAKAGGFMNHPVLDGVPTMLASSPVLEGPGTQKGIIHWDIKPSNVMVTLHDGVPVGKVIDFGIAKATQHELTEKTIFTQYGDFIGAPAYMSPEQAEMSGLDIDTRSDIYSLGVLLYELLVGRPPLDTKELLSGGFDEMRRRIKEEQAAKPSTRLRTLEGAEKTTTARHRKIRPEELSSELRGDLDWIVLKALEKNRTCRYETANGLAADLKRHLNNEPVTARPPSTTYRMKKFVRRNRLAVAAVAAVAVTLIVGVVLSSIGFVQARLQRDRAIHSAGEAKASAAEAERERKLAETRADELRRNLYVSNIARAATAFEAGNMTAVRTLLDACSVDLRHWEWSHLDWLAPSATELLLPGWELPLFTPDGRQIIALGDLSIPRAIKVWDAMTGELIRTFGQQKEIKLRSNALSPDGQRLFSASNDRTVRVWNTATWEEMLTLRGHERAVTSVVASRDGRMIASASSDGTVKI